MNYQNFNQSGGFPFQTETLDQIQKAAKLFNKFGYLAGNFSIVSGCVVSGGSVSDGAVFINGELLEFKGGILGTNVIIVEEVTAQEFEDGNDKDVLYVRYATFGIGVISFPWSDFKNCFPTNQLQAALDLKSNQTLIETLITRIETLENAPSNVPIGLVAIWGKPAFAIPTGWAEHLPLRGRSPVGHDPDYDKTSAGDFIDHKLNVLDSVNGKREVALTINEMPAHTHDVWNEGGGQTAGGGSGIEPTNGQSGSRGGGQAHTNMSPNRVVKFIIKVS